MGIAALLLVPVPVMASVVTSPDLIERRGAPIAQNFIGADDESVGFENVSFVATRQGVSCVASQKLPIADALYLGPDGDPVPFVEVTRSPASSVQVIAQPGNAPGFRIQLKYSPDIDQPIVLDLATGSLNLDSSLEPSTDSLWLSGDDARLLEEALRLGERPELRATSAGTGRQITDRIVAPDMVGFDACLLALDALQTVADVVQPVGEGVSETNTPSQSSFTPDQPVNIVIVDQPSPEPVLPVPVAGLRVELVARPAPEARITQDALESCRMRDIPDELYLGQLTSVTGFFAQTRDVYVAFDESGQLQRAYVPGIFDSDLSAGVNSAYLSLAADSNLPDEPNRVRGCLGDARLEASICIISAAEDDSYVLGECGVLGMSDTRDDFLSFLMDDSPAVLLRSPLPAPFGGPIPTPVAVRSAGFGGVGGFGGSGGGGRILGGNPTSGTDGNGPGGGGDWGFDGDDTGGGGNGGNPGGGDNPGTTVPSVPLPAGLWLMLTGLAFLSGAKLLRRLRIHA